MRLKLEGEREGGREGKVNDGLSHKVLRLKAAVEESVMNPGIGKRDSTPDLNTSQTLLPPVITTRDTGY